MGHGAKCTDTLINYPTRVRTDGTDGAIQKCRSPKFTLTVGNFCTTPSAHKGGAVPRLEPSVEGRNRFRHGKLHFGPLLPDPADHRVGTYFFTPPPNGRPLSGFMSSRTYREVESVKKMGVRERIPSRPGTSTESTGVRAGMQGQPRIHHRERDERPVGCHRMYDTRRDRPHHQGRTATESGDGKREPERRRRRSANERGKRMRERARA